MSIASIWHDLEALQDNDDPTPGEIAELSGRVAAAREAADDGMSVVILYAIGQILDEFATEHTKPKAVDEKSEVS